MNYLKVNIIFSLEKRKINKIPLTDNIPIRMRVSFLGNRVDFFTGYRVNLSSWNSKEQKVLDDSLNKLKQKGRDINKHLQEYEIQIKEIFKNFEEKNIIITPKILRHQFNLLNNFKHKVNVSNSNNNEKTLNTIQQAVRLGFKFHDTQEIQDIRYAAEEYLSKTKIKVTPGRKVDFKITEITDSVKEGSEVKKGSILNGIIGDDLKSIYFLDKADVEWIFYIGDTCKIIK